MRNENHEKEKHQWAKENSVHVWNLLDNKHIKQWFQHNNESYVLTNSEGCKLINSFNCITIINKGEIEFFDGYFDYPILVTKKGLVINMLRY